MIFLSAWGFAFQMSLHEVEDDSNFDVRPKKAPRHRAEPVYELPYIDEIEVSYAKPSLLKRLSHFLARLLR